MQTEVNSFCCHMDKKMISSHDEWYIGKGHGLVTIFFKTSTWYINVMPNLAVI